MSPDLFNNGPDLCLRLDFLLAKRCVPLTLAPFTNKVALSFALGGSSILGPRFSSEADSASQTSLCEHFSLLLLSLPPGIEKKIMGDFSYG